MSLPILSSHPVPSRADLIRMCHNAERRWCSQLGDETTLDIGTAITNADLDQVHDANVMLDASLPEGLQGVPAEAVAMVDEHYREQKTRCWKWIMNPSAPAERTQPLVDHLLSHGHTRGVYDLMHLGGQPAGVIKEVGGLTLIPARASYRHARELQAEASLKWNCPQLTEASMLHLEDPHSDSVMAMKDGKAVALVTVLAVGEIGCIEDVFVSAPYRGQGIGRTMMSRALEICARSLFKHVFLGCEPTNAPAIALYRKLGFERLADWVVYRANQTRP